ncbi:MAG: hypothetical protein WBE26_08280 [Phycisphaerae bacterium]
MNSGMLSEQELNEVLAEASSLAADLSEEVGASDKEPAVPTETGATPSEDGSLPADLDAELGELERLVGAAGSQLDTTSEPANESAPSSDESASSSKQPVASTGDLAIPDFMSEFTQPEESTETTSEKPAETAPDEPEPAASEPEPEAPAGVSQDIDPPAGVPKLGVVGTGMVGVIGTPIPASPVEGKLEQDQPAEKREETASQPGLVLRLANAICPAVTRLSPLAMSACERVVAGLEVIDRPLAKVGGPVRRLIGWIAIATVGMSVIVYLYSLV